MKKGLLFFTFIASFAASSYAQPSITSVTNAPKAGDVFAGHICDTTGISAGASGAGILWDFSALLTNYTDTSGYVTCYSTPLCDSFYGSNVVVASNNYTSYSYMSFSATRLKTLGSYDTSGSYIHFLDPASTLFYPFSYTSHYRDTFCVEAMSGGTDSFICDGFGTLVLPTGTHPNSLRTHLTTVHRDTFIVAGLPVINEYQSEVYNWYEQGFSYPLLSISYDTARATAPYVSNIVYYTMVPKLGVNNVPGNVPALQLYPNPVSDELNLKFNLADSKGAFITVTDVMGKVVTTIEGAQMHMGSNELSLPVNRIPAGIYTVQLHTASGSVAKKMVVSN
ncbi:MAG: hypothetical protein JWQ38_915 [Flavipsychrobacter sp.]|nr:hypothetical protein [Flavipsychrobacter sp.]